MSEKRPLLTPEAAAGSVANLFNQMNANAVGMHAASLAGGQIDYDLYDVTQQAIGGEIRKVISENAVCSPYYESKLLRRLFEGERYRGGYLQSDGAMFYYLGVIPNWKELGIFERSSARFTEAEHLYFDIENLFWGIEGNYAGHDEKLAEINEWLAAFNSHYGIPFDSEEVIRDIIKAKSRMQPKFDQSDVARIVDQVTRVLANDFS